MKIVFCWDDGALEDLKLFELHEKHNIPGMFFVPNVNCENRAVLTPNMIKNAKSQNISFGGHTQNHKYLTDIPLSCVEKEVKENQEYLENILEQRIDHFCLPGGRYNNEIIKIIYKYYKTIRTADTMNFNYQGGLLKPTFHFYQRGYKSMVGNAIRNKSYCELIYLMGKKKKTYFEIINEFMEYEKTKANSVIVIWGHSWEIEKCNLWGELEKLFYLVSDRYYEYCIAYDLIFK